MSTPSDPYSVSPTTSVGPLTGPILDALRGTRLWVKVIGVMLMVAAAFTLLATVIALLGGGMAGMRGGGLPVAGLAFIAVLYLGFAAVYVLMGLHLFRYAGAINDVLAGSRVEDLAQALDHQRRFWRIAGVMALVMLVFALLGIVAAIAIPVFSGR